MRKFILPAIIIAVLAVGSAVTYGLSTFHSTPVTEAPTTSQTYKKPTVSELLDLVNTERAKNGVAALKLDERLNQSAQRKADDMATYHYFAHVSPHDGKHGYEYINDVGIECGTDSENIAFSTDGTDVSSSEALKSWIDSPAHFSAMIDSKYTLTGFGIVGKAIVEHFCQQ